MNSRKNLLISFAIAAMVMAVANKSRATGDFLYSSDASNDKDDPTMILPYGIASGSGHLDASEDDSIDCWLYDASYAEYCGIEIGDLNPSESTMIVRVYQDGSDVTGDCVIPGHNVLSSATYYYCDITFPHPEEDYVITIELQNGSGANDYGMSLIECQD